jgi:hypothetical protein
VTLESVTKHIVLGKNTVDQKKVYVRQVLYHCSQVTGNRNIAVLVGLAVFERHRCLKGIVAKAILTLKINAAKPNETSYRLPNCPNDSRVTLWQQL